MKIKQVAVIAVFFLIICTVWAAFFLLPDNEISLSERRYLTQYQSYSDFRTEAVSAGKEVTFADYLAYLEKYSLDQFPARDTFRSLNAVFGKYVMGKKDNNGYYLAEGMLSRMDPVLNKGAVTEAVNTINRVYKDYFADSGANVYCTVIPDKNYFLAENNGYLHYDYNALFDTVSSLTDKGIKQISLLDVISLGDFYATDTHWNQAKILPVADRLLAAMGTHGILSDYAWTENTLTPFYGTFHGQAALPTAPDELVYLTCPEIEGARAYNYFKKTEESIYETKYFTNPDPYDVFLGGAAPVIDIDNPNCTNGKQLVIFRDSFGSSLAPLLLTEYSRIIMLDLRYISPEYIGQTVRFTDGCDVLFIHSTSILNSAGVFLQ